MRCSFSHISYAKAEAKLYAKVHALPLKVAQGKFALLAGYRNWKELSHSALARDGVLPSPPIVLDSSPFLTPDLLFDILSFYGSSAHGVREALLNLGYREKDIRRLLSVLRARVVNRHGEADCSRYPSFTFIQDENGDSLPALNWHMARLGFLRLYNEISTLSEDIRRIYIKETLKCQTISEFWYRLKTQGNRTLGIFAPQILFGSLKKLYGAASGENKPLDFDYFRGAGILNLTSRRAGDVDISQCPFNVEALCLDSGLEDKTIIVLYRPQDEQRLKTLTGCNEDSPWPARIELKTKDGFPYNFLPQAT